MSADSVLATARRKPAGRSAEVPGRLVVAWQHPVERSIEPVGFLSCDDQGYRFSYIRNALTVHDFPGLLGFDDQRASYRSDELFPLFAQRAMDPLMAETTSGTSADSAWKATLVRGNRSHDPRGIGKATQSSLSPEPTIDLAGISCQFLVHGVRHAHRTAKILSGVRIEVTRDQVDAALESLHGGDDLGMVPEPENPNNPLAIVVTAAPLIPIGWVPNLLVEDLHRLMERAQVHVIADHVNGPEAPWHLRVLSPAPGRADSWFPFLHQRAVGAAGRRSVGEHVGVATQLKCHPCWKETRSRRHTGLRDRSPGVPAP